MTTTAQTTAATVPAPAPTFASPPATALSSIAQTGLAPSPAMIASSTTTAPAPAPAPAMPAPSLNLSETATPVTDRATSIGTMPGKQKNVLKDIANLALSYAQPVSPGGVTAQQNQVLDAWQNNANSDFSQFMANQGMAQIASNPGVLFNEERAAAQSQWSMEDAKGAMSMLGLSAKDWDEYQKLQAQDEQRHSNFIFGAVEFVAGAALTFFSMGTLATVGVGMMASGAGTMAGNS